MARLVRVPLGASARRLFCKELEQMERGRGVLVLPSRLLQEEVQLYSDVECIGIDKLVAKLLNRNGYKSFAEINRRSQEIVVQDIIEFLAGQNKLAYFGALAQKQGFVKAMTSLVGQLSRSGVTAQELPQLLDNWECSAHQEQKNREVIQLYALYRQYLKNRDWFDLEGKYRLAIRVLQAEQVDIPWKKIYFSDFYTFDSLQLAFLQELAQHCEIAIAMNYEKNQQDVFGAVEPVYEHLWGFCKEEEYPVEKLPQAALSICALKSRDEEIRYVLTEIKKQLLAGAKSEDVLLAVRKLDKYTGLRRIADEYGIPLKLPHVAALAVQPLTELCQLLFASVDEGSGGVQAYFRMLASDVGRMLFTEDMEAVQNLRTENFFVTSEDVRVALQKQYPLQAEDVFLKQLEIFRETLPAQAVMAEYGQLLENFLRSLKLEERLGTLYKKQKITMDGLRTTVMTREALLECTHQLVEDYTSCGKGEEKITLGLWKKLWSEAVDQLQVVLEAGHENGVLVTEAVNTQGLSRKQVYIMGLREGEFPIANNENWIYNDRERAVLKSLGIDMPDTFTSFMEDAYFFAVSLAAARASIVLTYFDEDGSGASPYIGDVCKKFPAARYFYSTLTDFIEGIAKRFPGLRMEKLGKKAEASLQEYAQHGAELPDSFSRDAYAPLTAEVALTDKKREKQDEQGNAYSGKLEDAKLQQMVREKVGSIFSASSLEIYAKCPFAYLVQRVWKQEEFTDKDENTAPADEGSLLHEVLAEFMQPYFGGCLVSKQLEELEQELWQIFEANCEKYISAGKVVRNAFWEVEQDRLFNLLRRWLKFEYNERKAWQHYAPCATEWDFSSRNGRMLELPLADGEKVYLRGRVDRIDTDGKKLFITDYKRSGTPSASDLWDGFDMQLPVYILAVAQLYKGGMPVSGGSYYSLKDGKRSAALLLESVGNPDMKFSEKKLSALAGDDVFASFVEYSMCLLTGYIEKIYSGDFAVEPRKKCSEYCPARGICRVGIMGKNIGGADDE